MSRICFSPSATGTGDVTIASPVVNTPRTYVLPKNSGKLASFSLSTAVNATGTAVDFVNGVSDVVIPDDVTKITVFYSGLSTSATSNVIVQLGSGTFTVTGYSGSASNQVGGVVATFTTGFISMVAVAAANSYHGQMDLVRVSGNTWVEKSQFAAGNVSQVLEGCGSVTLAGAIDRIRVTTANGTDTFDAGIIAILVE